MSKKRTAAPVFQSPSKRFYLWAEMATAARRIPGEWMLALANVPASTEEAVRKRRHPDLRNLTGGRLTAEARNTYTDDEGTDRCDLWIRFIPEGEA